MDNYNKLYLAYEKLNKDLKFNNYEKESYKKENNKKIGMISENLY